ncbi:hypothetical protein K2Y11_12335 [bacterium]|nr:hypothetical protein [bacterium]
MRSAFRFAAVFGLAFSLTSVQAAFVVPGFRGEANTTYQEWNIFSSTAGPNAPDVANSNVNGTANVVELSGGAFVTSGGNIYSPTFVTSFSVTVPDFNLGSGYITNAVIQIRTQGTNVDNSSVLFNGVSAVSATLLHSEVLGGFGGNLEDWEYVFSNVPSNLSLDTITFHAAGSSMSLDRLSVDTQAVAVPEVSSFLMIGVAAATVFGIARRRAATK